MLNRKIYILFLALFALTFSNCQGNKKSKGFNYEQHAKDNADRVKETRKRNKKTKSLLDHKGKSVKSPKRDEP